MLKCHRYFGPFVFLCILLGAVSCQSKYGDVRDNFLEQVKGSHDPLKYKVALYLAKNMNDEYSLQGASLDLYCSQLDSFYQRKDANVFTLREYNDSLFSSGDYFGDLHRIDDVAEISSEYLMGHLNRSMELWRTSKWAKDLSFKEFCEFILPYRVSNEKIEDWHSDYRNEFGLYLDSLSKDEHTSLEQFCSAVNSILHKPHSYNGYPVGKPSLPPSILKKIKAGSCDDYVSLFIHIARAYGVPVAEDYTPQWGNHSQGHSWVAVMDGKETRHYAVGEPLFHEKEKPFTWRLVKAYRKHGGEDVTDKYTETVDVQVKVESSLRERMAALSVFNDKDWKPICYARIRNRKAVFHKLGFPAVFLPSIAENGVVSKPAGYPILVDSTGHSHILKPDRNHLVSVRLKRKFLETHVWRWVDSLKDGRFELSVKHDFIDSFCISMPDSIGFNYQDIHLNGQGVRCRYARYVPPENTSGNIAEIEFYDQNDLPIKGRIIGNYISGDSSHSMHKAFDGDPLTFSRCKPYQISPWLGVDFGREVSVSRISFLPRSDDNFIREGDEYELCYWDGRWIPLGRKVGSRQTQELLYDNVPDNALLLLHNYTRGKEERIFTYEKGRQVWW